MFEAEKIQSGMDGTTKLFEERGAKRKKKPKQLNSQRGIRNLEPILPLPESPFRGHRAETAVTLLQNCL